MFKPVKTRDLQSLDVVVIPSITVKGQSTKNTPSNVWE